MKAVCTVSSIIYLIIATVFILNSQFSQEAFAPGNSGSDDSSNSDNAGNAGASSDLSSNDDAGDDCDDGCNDSPSDLSSSESNNVGDERFWHNSQDIAMELNSLTPAEI